MGIMARWAVRRPVIALISWFVTVVIAVGVGLGFGGNLNDSFDLPDTESTVAQEYLGQLPNAGGSSGASVRIVWSPTQGTVLDPAVVDTVTPVLEQISTLSAVECVQSPYPADPANPAGPRATFGTDCPAPADNSAFANLTPEELEQLQPAIESAISVRSPISADGAVAYATVSFPGDGTDVPTEELRTLVADVDAINSPELQVGAIGQILDLATTAPPSSEAIGILVAIIILLIAFGSVVAAGIPIAVALFGLAVGQMLVLVVARFMDVATFAPTLAAMIGLGVGIDYALFVLNRYRQAVLVGHDPKRAAMEAVNTAGRAVQFAGITVIFALLGLFVLGISFFNGLSLAAAATVFSVMLSALWLLPALLSLLGSKALALRLPWASKKRMAAKPYQEGKYFFRYGHFLQRRPIIPTLVALGVVLVLAIPLLSLRLGFADESGRAEGSPQRIAYDLNAEGFGPGANGPFFAAVVLPEPGDAEAFATAVTDLANTPGVAGTVPTVEMLPLVLNNPAAFSPDGLVGSVLITPASAPQDQATRDLLTQLRTVTDPAILASTGAAVYIGGAQAVTQDFTTVLTDALPIFLGVVIALGFLALMVLFRSIVVPLTAAVTSLLSFAAAMGITVAIFQWGWASGLLGISNTGPIFPFLPVMVFAILFGLSMDYQVFLVSRMQEEWGRTGDNRASVRRGLAGSGRVVAIAAAIMSSVFLAFVPSPDSTIKLFGIALASAIIIDAFIVRLILVPSLMSMLGKANWWLPGWLNRILPNIKVEHGEDEIVSDVDGPDPDSDPRLLEVKV